MLKILTKRERVILYLTLAVIISAISFNFVIAPVATKNEVLNKEIKITQARLKKYLRLQAQKEGILDRYNQISQGMSAIGTRAGNFTSGLSEIENIARASGISIVEIRPQATATTKKTSEVYQEVCIDLRTEGREEGYLKFMSNIENSLSLLHITRCQLLSKPNTQTLEGYFTISQLIVKQ